VTEQGIAQPVGAGTLRVLVTGPDRLDGPLDTLYVERWVP
jgi:hypothetical protein